MNPGAIRIDTYEFFRRAKISYKWDLSDKEKSILYRMAKKHTASLILDNWELFQIRNPGHPAWEFEEWFLEIMKPSDDYEEE